MIGYRIARECAPSPTPWNCYLCVLWFGCEHGRSIVSWRKRQVLPHGCAGILKVLRKQEEECCTRLVHSVVSCCLCRLTVHKGRKRTEDSDATNLCLKSGCEKNSGRTVEVCDKGSCTGKGNGARTWKTRLIRLSESLDGSYSPELEDEWKDWRVDDPDSRVMRHMKKG